MAMKPIPGRGLTSSTPLLLHLCYLLCLTRRGVRLGRQRSCPEKHSPCDITHGMQESRKLARGLRCALPGRSFGLAVVYDDKRIVPCKDDRFRCQHIPECVAEYQ